jgi:hypothetical protein
MPDVFLTSNATGRPHTISPLDSKTNQIYSNSQFVTHSKHSVIKFDLLITLPRGITAVRSETHTKPTNVLCGLNVGCFNGKPGGT